MYKAINVVTVFLKYESSVILFLAIASLEAIHERPLHKSFERLSQPCSSYLDFFYVYNETNDAESVPS